MKKLTLTISLMAVTFVHAQQTVVIERSGVLTDLVSAAGTILALQFATAEGVGCHSRHGKSS